MFYKDNEDIIGSLDPKYHKNLIENLKNNQGYTKVNSNNTDGPSYDLILELFKKAMNSLNEKYIDGTVDYIDKFYPGLINDIYDAQSKVHESAKDYTEGSISIEKFKPVLYTWYNLHLKSIEIYGNTLVKKK